MELKTKVNGVQPKLTAIMDTPFPVKTSTSPRTVDATAEPAAVKRICVGEHRMNDSRAVILKLIESDMDECTRCGKSITSDTDRFWVVANVYAGPKKARKWNRLEHFHSTCYNDAGSPYGVAEKKKSSRIELDPEDWSDESDAWHHDL